jgi:hypothetical protein
MNLVVVEAVELWKTRREFSKPCGKAALPKGWFSIGRQIYSWVRRGCRGRREKVRIIGYKNQIRAAVSNFVSVSVPVSVPREM